MRRKWRHPLQVLNSRGNQHKRENAMTEKDLGVSVAEDVKTKEAFGPAAAQSLDKQLKGLGGTLHVTREEDLINVASLAWQLSRQTKLPVVVVVKATS